MSVIGLKVRSQRLVCDHFSTILFVKLIFSNVKSHLLPKFCHLRNGSNLEFFIYTSFNYIYLRRFIIIYFWCHPAFSKFGKKNDQSLSISSPKYQTILTRKKSFKSLQKLLSGLSLENQLYKGIFYESQSCKVR